MGLNGRVVRAESADQHMLESMYALMKQYYDGVSYDSFIQDLSEKDWLILLEESDQIVGFSSQMLYEHVIERESVSVLFSGDTIIDKAYWGTFTLPVTWVRMMRTIHSQNPQAKLYWFLISKGHRTYRFLPTFFKSYFPSPDDISCEFEKNLLRQVALDKFGSRFDPETFLIQSDKGSQRLKRGISDVTEPLRKNRYILFFEEKNPGYIDGEELACIARFDLNNLTPFILKRTNNPIALGDSG